MMPVAVRKKLQAFFLHKKCVIEKVVLSFICLEGGQYDHGEERKGIMNVTLYECTLCSYKILQKLSRLLKTEGTRTTFSQRKTKLLDFPGKRILDKSRCRPQTLNSP